MPRRGVRVWQAAAAATLNALAGGLGGAPSRNGAVLRLGRPSNAERCGRGVRAVWPVGFSSQKAWVSLGDRGPSPGKPSVKPGGVVHE